MPFFVCVCGLFDGLWWLRGGCRFRFITGGGAEDRSGITRNVIVLTVDALTGRGGLLFEEEKEKKKVI